jgi:serine protease Do
MFQRYFFPALAAVALAVPVSAQPREGRLPEPIQANPNFLALFKPTLSDVAKSVVRVQVDGKDAALGTVVTQDGYVLTKASELKLGKVTVKTSDGRTLPADVTTTSDAYDLAVLKADGSGLVPINWVDSKDAPVGNWIAVPGPAGDAVAVGVVSTRPWSPREPDKNTGFLGVMLDTTVPAGAVISQVTEGSAAAKAGLKAKDVIKKVDGHDIADGEALIHMLLAYRAGESVKLELEREGKHMEVTAVLGKRPGDLLPQRGGRGDFQNAMGSKLSDRRSGIPVLFQTDAVVKPTDCGAPVVDLDGHAVGLVIARAGRTESHAVPAETVKALIPVLLATRPRANPSERVDQARAELKKVEADHDSLEVIAEAKRQLQTALGDEKWWKDQKWWKGHPIERGPNPHPAATPSKK